MREQATSQRRHPEHLRGSRRIKRGLLIVQPSALTTIFTCLRFSGVAGGYTKLIERSYLAIYRVRMRILATYLLVLALAATVFSQAQPLTQQLQRQTAGLTPSPFVFTVEGLTVIDSSADRGVVQLTVSYFGKRTLLGARAELEPECNASVLSGQPVALGSWRPGTAKTFQVTLNTSAANPVCPARLVISWDNAWDDSLATLTYEAGTVSLDLSIAACWGESVSVKVSPSTLYSGSPNLVSVIVENRGRESVSSLLLSVYPQGAVLLDREVPAVFTLPRLEPGQSASLYLSLVPLASPTLQISLSYVSCTGSVVSRTVSVPLFAASGQSVLVAPDPAVVTAGSPNRINLHVVNVGSVPLQGVRVILSLQKSQISVKPSLLDVGSLQPGEDKVFTVEVLAPTTASSSEAVNYQVLFTTASGSISSLQGVFTLFTVFASGLTITSLEVVPQQPQVGSNLILAATLVNDGSLPIYAVNVSVHHSRGLTPLRTPYAFLGQLNPQVLTSVPFSFRVEEEGVHELRVTASFRDSYGVSRTVERSILVNAVARQAAQGSQGSSVRNSTAVAVLVLALAGAVVFALRKRVFKRESG